MSEEFIEIARNVAGPLTASVASSLVGYYFTCRYADLSESLRELSLRKHTESIGDTPSSDRGKGRVSFADSPKQPVVSETGHGCSCRVLVFAISGIGFFSLEVFALMKLSVSVVIPFKMLFFVWASIYRLRKTGLDCRFITLICTITVLVSLAVYSSIENIVKVEVEERRPFDVGTIVYLAIFLVSLLLLFCVKRSLKMTNRLASYCCLLSIETRDMRTILRCTLAGMVGGQSMVLIKLLAEIVEGVVLSDFASFNNVESYSVAVLVVLFVIAHLYFFNSAMTNIRDQNPALIIPCYKLALMLSAGVGSGAYLHELQDKSISMQSLYIVCMTGLISICITLCYFALNGSAAERLKRKRAVSTMMDGMNLSVDYEPLRSGEFNDFAIANGMETGKPRADKISSPHSQVVDRLTPGSKNGIWGVGVADEDDEEFFMSRDRSSTLNSYSSRSRAYSRQYTEQRPAATIPALNYDYPPSEDSMVVKQGLPNPHAEGIKSSWVDPGAEIGQWNVRGPNYLKDRVKIPSLPTRMQQVQLEWLYFPKNPVQFVSKLKHGYVQKHQANRKDRPFMFVINFMIPSIGNYVSYFVKRQGVHDSVFDKMLEEFCNAEDDAYRNERFKLIPGVLKGSYVVRNFVGRTPAIIGKKLTTSYHKGSNFFEVSIDVGSSRIGRSIMGAVKGYATTLVLHMAYLIESKTPEELPERVLGGIDIYYPAMSPATDMNLSLELVDDGITTEDGSNRETGTHRDSDSVAASDAEIASDAGYESCEGDLHVLDENEVKLSKI